METGDAAPAPSRARGRDVVGLVVGVVLVAAMTAVDHVMPDRSFPLTAVLIGPFVAAALAGSRHVALAGLAAVAAAAGLAVQEELAPVEAGTRTALVAVGSLAAVVTARVRTHREGLLAQSERVASQTLVLQRRLLPALGSSACVEVWGTYRPRSDELVLAGDFIDVVPFEDAGPGAVAFCVGDVTGHDATAAGLGASLRAAWRALALSGGDPAAWLRSMDRLIRAETADDDHFATACVGVLDPASRRLLVASAGHPRPVMLTSHAGVIDVEAGPPLGLPAGLGASWTTEAFALDTRFAVVLYTDGLIEGRRAPASKYRYGEESLTAWLDAAVPAYGLDQARLDQLLTDVEAANGGRLQDDVAVVVLAGRTAPSGAVPPGEADLPVELQPDHRSAGR